MLKLFITPSLLVFLLIGCTQSNSSKYKEEVFAVADAKAEMTIDGMSCQVGCAAYIDEELEKVSGVISADVSFKNKLASIAYDNSLISEHDIVSTINSLKDSAYSVASVEVEILKTIEKVKIDTH
jgi:copper chaperone CopZ